MLRSSLWGIFFLKLSSAPQPHGSKVLGREGRGRKVLPAGEGGGALLASFGCFGLSPGFRATVHLLSRWSEIYPGKVVVSQASEDDPDFPFVSASWDHPDCLFRDFPLEVWKPLQPEAMLPISLLFLKKPQECLFFSLMIFFHKLLAHRVCHAVHIQVCMERYHLIFGASRVLSENFLLQEKSLS